MASLKLSPLSASRNFVQKRDFRTSLPRAALPPLLVMFLKPLSRLASVLIGRSTRIWWKKLDPAQKLVYKQKIVQYRAPILGSGVCLMGMSGLLYQSHLETCPITKRKKFVALKPNQMEKIAAVEFSNLLETYEDDLLPDKNPAYDRVARVCNRILRANADIPEVHGKDWTITVVDQDIRNAFVLPSGNIFVFTGMLQTCGNDDQLGVVMAHEISHTLLGHVSEKLSYVNFVNFLVLVPLALLWAVLPNDGISIVANWFFDKGK